eukprot:8154271-Pyramimonas_sp.AAC.1
MCERAHRVPRGGPEGRYLRRAGAPRLGRQVVPPAGPGEGPGFPWAVGPRGGHRRRPAGCLERRRAPHAQRHP